MPAALELLNDPARQAPILHDGRNMEYRCTVKWSGEKTPLDSIHSLKILAQRHQELVFRNLGGSSLTVFETALVYSAQKRRNRVWILRRPESVAQKNIHINVMECQDGIEWV